MPEEPETTITLLTDSVDARGRRHLLAGAGDRILVRLWAEEDHEALRVGLDDDDVPLTVDEWRGLVAALTSLAGREQRVIVLGATAPLLMRNAARAAGFTGPLRNDLVSRGRRPDHDASLEARFLVDVNALVPGVTVASATRPVGRLRSALRSASAGVAGTVYLTVADGSAAKPLSLAVPLGDDVMAEGVALAIDTAVRARQRFHPLLDGVRIFYDQSIHGLRSGTIAGLAEPGVRDIHLNPAYAQAGELATLERFLYERRTQAERGQGQPARRPPLTVAPPFTRVDAVVAHELWHQIEFGFESGRYRDSVEFRRAVGAYFGVETLEHVIRGDNPKAPAAWQAACARLAGEVSAYATKAPKEATAELFTQWWCTAAAPPPSAIYFGQVLHRFFPGAA